VKSINLDTILVPNAACPVREIGDGLIIMAPTGTATHTLEELGAFVWRQLDGQRTLRQVAEAIVSEYDVTLDAAAKDLCEFASQLVAAELVGAQ
jgi:hypothetical protein